MEYAGLADGRHESGGEHDHRNDVELRRQREPDVSAGCPGDRDLLFVRCGQPAYVAVLFCERRFLFVE